MQPHRRDRYTPVRPAPANSQKRTAPGVATDYSVQVVDRVGPGVGRVAEDERPFSALAMLAGVVVEQVRHRLGVGDVGRVTDDLSISSESGSTKTWAL